MRSNFSAHLPLSLDQIAKTWRDGLFVFDTNALLNFYRYSDRSRTEFIQVLRQLNARIWIPDQVAREFFKRRLGVMVDQGKSYEETKLQIESLKDSLRKERGHPFLSDDLMGELSVLFDRAISDLTETQKTLSSRLTQDEIAMEIAELFDGRVGSESNSEDLEKIFADGAIRYELKIPPGYMDSKKHAEPKTQDQKISVFGDLIVWKQTIEMASTRKSSVVFITDDRKEDWWLEVVGKTIGPRPELVKEFCSETGQDFLMYRPEQFLQYAKDHLQSKVSAETIKEISNNTKDEKIRGNWILQADELGRKIRVGMMDPLGAPPRDEISADGISIEEELDLFREQLSLKKLVESENAKYRSRTLDARARIHALEAEIKQLELSLLNDNKNELDDPDDDAIWRKRSELILAKSILESERRRASQELFEFRDWLGGKRKGGK